MERQYRLDTSAPSTSGLDPDPSLPFDIRRAGELAPGGALAALGQTLRAGGLRKGAVEAATGGMHPLHARLEADQLARSDDRPETRLARLFVGGHRLPVDAVVEQIGGGALDLLLELGLVEVAIGTEGDEKVGESHVWARATVMPVGGGLVVCERIDAPPALDTVMAPDVSAGHILSCLPPRGRPRRWLDVATGCGTLPLAAPAVARQVLGTDINARALPFARLGAWLSGASQTDFAQADLLAEAHAGAPWDLITFNPPIPAEVAVSFDDVRRPFAGNLTMAPVFLSSPAGAALLERFWAEVPDLVAPGGEVIVHSYQPGDDYPQSLALPGTVAVARYTPDDDDPFGVTIWRPDGPSRVIFSVHLLTWDSPFVPRDPRIDDR